jgi:hypothetical protein
MTTRLLVLALVALAISGCSSAQPGAAASAASRSSSQRARCLVDPSEGNTRPLIYLLCIESP